MNRFLATLLRVVLTEGPCEGWGSGNGGDRTNALLIGSGSLAARFLASQPERRLRVRLVGLLSDSASESEVKEVARLGSPDKLEEIVHSHRVRHVFLAVEGIPVPEILAIFDRLSGKGVSFYIIGPVLKAVNRYFGHGKFPELPVVRLCSDRPTVEQLKRKRLVEVAFSLAALLLLLPVLVLIAAAIKFTSPGSVFFSQLAVSRNGRKFMMHKFRTMETGKGAERHRAWTRNIVRNGDLPYTKMEDEDRITRIGRVLRKFSLDELPQLYNVVKGEMSLIGPRPPLIYEYEEYEEWHKRRLSIRPGITGLHQVLARDESSFNDMVALDLYYIHNYSLLLDCFIAVSTIPVMLLGKGGG